MADLPIKGGGVAALHAAALLEDLGDQKNYWSTQVISAYIGADPKLILHRAGVKVYEDTWDGTPTVDGGDILMPNALAGTPGTNSAADIDSGTWTLTIEKASDSSKGIGPCPLGKAGAGLAFSLAGDLDGTLLVTQSGTIRLGAPDTLDAGFVEPETGIPAYSPQVTVDDMGLHNDAKGFGASNYYVTADQPGQVPAAVSFGVRQNPQEQADWIRAELQNTSYWNILWRYMYPWSYTFTAEGHSATNLRLRISKAKFLVRNRASKQWSAFMSAAGASSYSWAAAALANGQSLDQAPDLSVRTAGAGAEILVPNMFALAANQRYNLHGFWAGQTYMDCSSYDCIMHICLAQLVLDNPAGVDQRANARLMMHLGGDFYPAQGGNNSSGGLFGRFIPFPGFAASRLKFVTATPKWFASANLLNARQDYNMPAGATPPNSISVDSFLLNPPPRALVEA